MSRNTWIAVVISIGVVGFFLFGGTIVDMFMSADQVQNTAALNGGSEFNSMDDIQKPSEANTDGLIVQDQVVGTGDEAVNGTLVTVHYVGTFENGQKFDSSIDNGRAFQFILGKGNVIKGWDLGIAGMKVGGKRLLKVSPDLGYGSQKYGPIPANSTLIFEVELLKVDKLQ